MGQCMCIRIENSINYFHLIFIIFISRLEEVEMLYESLQKNVLQIKLQFNFPEGYTQTPRQLFSKAKFTLIYWPTCS